MIELLSSPQAWVAFLTLTALELVLGIDNLIFISILVDKLPRERRDLARRFGLFLAMFTRIGLLFLLSWIVGLTEPLVTVLRQDVSGRDLILIGGGLFLLWKSAKRYTNCWRGNEAQPPRRSARRFRRSFFRLRSSTSCSHSIPSSPPSGWLTK